MVESNPNIYISHGNLEILAESLKNTSDAIYACKGLSYKIVSLDRTLNDLKNIKAEKEKKLITKKDQGEKKRKYMQDLAIYVGLMEREQI